MSPARKHPQHVLGELEQPQSVRDRGLRPSDALRDVAERELELVDERGIGARLLDRRELLAGDVLDEAEEKRVAIPDVPDERREALRPRQPAPRASAARLR